MRSKELAPNRLVAHSDEDGLRPMLAGNQNPDDLLANAARAELLTGSEDVAMPQITSRLDFDFSTDTFGS